MKFKNIKDYSEITKLVNLYYKEPRKLMEMIGEEWEEIPKEKPVIKPLFQSEQKVVGEVPRVAVEVPRVRRPTERVSVLSLFGFKMLREKS